MKIAVLNQKGEKVSDVELSDIFDGKVSAEARALYINYLRNAMRDPIANSKDRSDVSGGGKKPYKQKGTGRARQGSTRSPLFVGGGVTFGPSNERNFRVRINKGLKRKVILGILGEMLTGNKAIVIDSLKVDEPKTKYASEVLDNIKASGKISLILSESDVNALISFRNIAGVKAMVPGRLDIVSIMTSDNLVLSLDAIRSIEATYTKA